MGTTWTVHWSQPEGGEARALRPLLLQALARLVAQMSHWAPESDLCHYNRAPAGSRVPLAPEFATVMRAALAIAAAGEGAFDPSAGPLVGSPRPALARQRDNASASREGFRRLWLGGC